MVLHGCLNLKTAVLQDRVPSFPGSQPPKEKDQGGTHDAAMTSFLGFHL